MPLPAHRHSVTLSDQADSLTAHLEACAEVQRARLLHGAGSDAHCAAVSLYATTLQLLRADNDADRPVHP